MLFETLENTHPELGCSVESTIKPEHVKIFRKFDYAVELTLMFLAVTEGANTMSVMKDLGGDGEHALPFYYLEFGELDNIHRVPNSVEYSIILPAYENNYSGQEIRLTTSRESEFFISALLATLYGLYDDDEVEEMFSVVLMKTHEIEINDKLRESMRAAWDACEYSKLLYEYSRLASLLTLSSQTNTLSKMMGDPNSKLFMVSPSMQKSCEILDIALLGQLDKMMPELDREDAYGGLSVTDMWDLEMISSSLSVLWVDILSKMQASEKYVDFSSVETVREAIAQEGYDVWVDAFVDGVPIEDIVA